MAGDQRSSQEQRRSLIYVLPIEGGTPRRLDAARAFVLARLVAGRKDAGLRRAQRQFRDIYTMPVEAAPERG